MLGVFLLPEFTRLEHKYKDLLSLVMECMCAQTRSLYSHLKEFLRNGVGTHVSSKGKIPSTAKILFRGVSEPQHCVSQDSDPNTLPAEVFWLPR